MISSQIFYTKADFAYVRYSYEYKFIRIYLIIIFSGKNVAQPDNAEFDINESVEACMGILNDIYEDGIKWHDIACYHTKPFVCEDSEQLLEYARLTNPELNIF